MSTISHDAPGPHRVPISTKLRIPEMWASIAISMMWLAVALCALFGPDFVSNSAGGNFTKIPSAVFIAVFAWLATIVVAKRGFGPEK